MKLFRIFAADPYEVPTGKGKWRIKDTKDELKLDRTSGQRIENDLPFRQKVLWLVRRGIVKSVRAELPETDSYKLWIGTSQPVPIAGSKYYIGLFLDMLPNTRVARIVSVVIKDASDKIRPARNADAISQAAKQSLNPLQPPLPVDGEVYVFTYDTDLNRLVEILPDS